MRGGTVRNAQGGADDDAAVIVFPSDGAWINLGANARRLRSVRVLRSGAYSLAALPPGVYDIVAVKDALSTNWQDPVFLQKLSRVALHVTLGDGQNLSLDLTTVVVR